MARVLRIACGQLGGISPAEPRASAVARMLELMRQASAAGAALIVFPELALTTFFPRYVIQDPATLNGWFERAMPDETTQPLFAGAAKHGIGFFLGFAELTATGQRFNSAVLVDAGGAIVGHYRKVHLPGDAEPQPGLTHQHLEKRYFEVGDLGFPVFEAFGTRIGLALCNDRRWPETYRVMALQGAEVVLIGYNTPMDPDLYPASDALSAFQNHLSIQSGAHHNALWVAATAKCGVEDGARLLAGSAIASPTGELAAVASSSADELIVADCDLDAAQPYREDLFNFARHRRIEDYGLIVERRSYEDARAGPLPSAAITL
ncbi:nitrilase-related carbon-nitrogen hydrolase [Novosphingobium sp. Gsoil 351]|uniref:nitrilase-related carbon-nitrogen hydrolase n=1 Tax=Novosphingobium sp. Gsoil 351 TaxID=2675225 RepID=UPI0012B4EE16|nr:nitrilase-related carbon-nitrogen hydrolase [Novosphingobium sp. Gsoil 351]QGN56493.1 N-carbamoyl-D-amino-acid hydrolase [Novosphingobium sp. Gsoil 351]